MLLALLKYFPIYIAAIGLAGLMWQRPVTLTLCYVVITALILWRYHRRGDLIYFVVPFFMGPLGELLPVRLGAWEYSKPLALIPLWLPFAWGLAGLFMRRVSDICEEFLDARAPRV
ncbi:MAG: hypothetical protein V3T72_22400 [Thermoanaerobaculia bacterium]